MIIPRRDAAEGKAGASYTGVVRSRIESDLGFRVDGKITQRLVDAGQKVVRGQALMRLDPADLGLAADAAIDRQRAAEAEAVRTAADVARLDGLVEAGAVSAASRDAALAARQVAAANLAAVRAAARESNNRRAYSTLVADSDGVVTEILAQPGQVVAAGAPVVRLSQAGAREALIAVPETAVSSLPRDATARLYAAGDSLPARLREVAGAADPLTRTYAARYVLRGSSASAAPLGATVTITIGAAGRNSMSIPQGAVHEAGSGPGVWVVERGGRVRFRRVDVLSLGDDAVLIAQGALRAGERIVVLGAQLLHEGDPVRLAAGVARPAA